MAQREAPPQKPQSNPLFSLISKFFGNPQQLKNEQDKKAETAQKEESVKRVGGEERDSKPNVVRFPLTQPEVKVPPLKLESDEAEKDTNPIVLWQVYALGGFIVLRWVWAKWQERKAAKAKKDESGEEKPPADD